MRRFFSAAYKPRRLQHFKGDVPVFDLFRGVPQHQRCKLFVRATQPVKCPRPRRERVRGPHRALNTERRARRPPS